MLTLRSKFLTFSGGPPDLPIDPDVVLLATASMHSKINPRGFTIKGGTKNWLGEMWNGDETISLPAQELKAGMTSA